MTKDLLIVFVKNPELGKVKTRLAKTIGNQAAFEVYSDLLIVTEKATEDLSVHKHIYFSEAIDDSKWKNHTKAIQQGNNLGERMKNAFQKGFEDGYKRIILIGSDLPDINSLHIENGFQALNESDVVFGPAEDGGYYLIGLTRLNPCIFENKPWSQTHLLKQTLDELRQTKTTFKLLDTLNDIDTYEDLIVSNFYKNNKALQTRIIELND